MSDIEIGLTRAARMKPTPITIYLTDGSDIAAPGQLGIIDGNAVVSGPDGVVLAVAKGTWRMAATDDAQVVCHPAPPTEAKWPMGGSFA